MTDDKITISTSPAQIACQIGLTGSKSESNRALIIQALSNGKVEIRNLSSADDTVILTDGLRIAGELLSEATDRIDQERGGSQAGQNSRTIDIGPAGTAMRFLAAYCAVKGCPVIITGTERMRQRPIGLLTDALRTLGASVNYVEKEGFPPLRIGPHFRQTSDNIRIQGNISSQYISALLLVAPSLPQGLHLTIEGELTSRPYVEMTLSLLNEAGVSYTWNENTVVISHQHFAPSTITIEPDWSAASYWYSIAALSQTARISLPNLKRNSLQGDSSIKRIMEGFGVKTDFTTEGALLRKEKNVRGHTPLSFDLQDCPDLAQTLIVCCAALKREANFTGLETLKIKETDRIAALQKELYKIGALLKETGEVYHLDCSMVAFPQKVCFDTYEDHRMAMALSPLALKIPEVEIRDPGVVRKSYPSFWDDLKKTGFTFH